MDISCIRGRKTHLRNNKQVRKNFNGRKKTKKMDENVSKKTLKIRKSSS